MAKKKTTRKPAANPAPVDVIKHKTDKRTNIPTRETAALVTDDEAAPKTVLYPRDPSLDPQLVWKGKDEQDAKALEVPAVPIYIDTSRVALALARTRLMAAKFPYYLLADSPEGRRKEASLTGQPAPDTPTGGDIRKGFVYKRVPHVTLKSIANNPDIKEGMTREQIDAAIRKHADTETLYDQPYEDNGIVRVTGPFTVESLSPHRMLPGEPAALAAGLSTSNPAANAAGSPNFVQTILDNLKKAGVQNTVKNERLVFERLDTFPGEYIHAEGTFFESGTSKGVRVSIGPEFIDTDYNGESFFVRHAYFCGAEEPYQKLKKALRAEIDEAEWSKLYATKSLPFEAPKKGKIAVKVINHYGDEVLKVFRVP